MTIAAIPLADAAATERLGARLALILRAGDAIELVGPLGAGKSTLARGLIKDLCGAVDVPSPTYTFVETYEAAAFTISHFDFYRLEAPGDAAELGLEEALDGVVLMEWPEKIGALAPDGALRITLTDSGAGRRAEISGDADWKGRILAARLIDHDDND